MRLQYFRLAIAAACALFVSTASAATTCTFDYSELSCKPTDACHLQYKYGDTSPAQACRAVTATVDVTKVPMQHHLAFAGSPAGTGMTISWTTTAKVSDPQVWIGTTQAKLALSSAAVETKTYYSDSSYSLYTYHATVTGLTANSQYFYKVGSASSTDYQSDVASFTTAKPAGSKDTFEIAVYGDFGVDKNAAASNQFVNSLTGKIDFVYHVGDISYADNAFLTFTEFFGFYYEETYNRWVNSLTALMRQMPYMVLVGNHEAECHSPTCLLSGSKKDQLGNYTAFNTRFKMPSVESGGAKNMWYSFDYASVHFTTISSETDYPNAASNSYTGRTYGNFGNQLAWLEADLKKANENRGTTPWLIVGMHRAVYTLRDSDNNGVPTGEALPVQAAFEELFIKYKVDLVVSGHVHAYERHLPIARNKPVLDGVSADRVTYTKPQAPVYVISGATGSSEAHASYKDFVSPWAAQHDDTHYGISQLKVTPSTLSWKFLATETGTIYDQFVITKLRVIGDVPFGFAFFPEKQNEMRARTAAVATVVFTAFACCAARRQAKAHAAAVCVYDYDALSCGPLDVCRLQYAASDATPAQACRSIDILHPGRDAAKMQPQQLHLAFAGSPAGSGVTISWTMSAQVADPKVWIGATQAALVLADATIETKSYYSDASYSLYNYHATIRGLSASTKYFYKVGSAASPEWQSDVASFVTSRAAGSQATFRLAIYGDFGTGKHAAASNRYVNALVDKVDFIYHVGDISYADDAFLNVKEFTGFHYEETYNRWMNSLTPLMRQVPYMVVVGNHEAECHSPACVLSSAKKDQLGNYTAFNARFKMPSTESHGTKNMWYSFDYASAHFTTISSETDYVGAPSNAYAGRKNGDFGNQLVWLEADLKKADANRAAVPWLIVGMHRPLYTICTSSKAGAPTGEALPVQKAFEELFIKYKVDLVVSGHVHGYERQYPIVHSHPVLDGISSDRATYTSPKAPVYIISGAPGSPEGLVRYKKSSERAWSVRFDDTHNGIGLLQVTPRTLSWSFVATNSSQTLDSFVIVKEPSAWTAVS